MEWKRGKDSEALKDGIEVGTRIHHPRSILGQDSILPLETRHPARHGGERMGSRCRQEGCWGEDTRFLLIPRYSDGLRAK